jgi:alpha-L-fucosidase
MEMLIHCPGGDGNLLLNAGPMPTGEIAPEQAHRLKELGAWLAQYGQSIYGTRGGPFKPGDYGVSTRKNTTVYLHICDWPEDTLKLPAITPRILSSRVLGGGRVEVHQTQTAIEVSVPQADRRPIETIVALELTANALGLPAVEVPSPAPLTAHAKATASNVFGNQAEYGPEKAIDGRDDTRWATDSGTKSAWLELDLGRPLEFSRALIKQAFPDLHRVRKFAIEYLQDGQWKACYRGEDPGPKLRARFEPVTAQRVRLNITEATDGPTIREFQLFQ